MRVKPLGPIRHLKQSRGYVDKVHRLPTMYEMTIVWLCIGVGVALPFVPPAIESWKNRLNMTKSEKLRSFDMQSANEEETVA